MDKSPHITFTPGKLTGIFEKTSEELNNISFAKRLWEHDYTLWSNQPDEITNRLDWLELYQTMPDHICDINSFTDIAKSDGFGQALLMGMGGSSLAPEVFSKTFGTKPGFLDLYVLDSTDPDAIHYYQEKLDLERTLFIISTKSGGTVETLSFFKYFYTLLAGRLGVKEAGMHFVAITDPGSNLEKIAKDLGFRATFLNTPNLGGRYSALSLVGLVPAALQGIGISLLLENAGEAAEENKPDSAQPAIALGALLGAAQTQGVDKLTFISSPALASFSDWVEQLIAESTGKSGKGILPVVGEAFSEDLSVYGEDRIFVITYLRGDEKLQQIAAQLKEAGFPVIEIVLSSVYCLGNLMLSWEIATAVAGHVINIHPFNQPNVESAKILARQSLQKYQETGELPPYEASDLTLTNLHTFLSQGKPGDYVTLQAYVNPSPSTEQAFRKLQQKIRDEYKLATTFGFGPRFLHSTGQLHKGDQGNGLFVQFISHPQNDLNIPEKPGSTEKYISFATLKKAQAIGDAKALTESGRRVISFDVDQNLTSQILEIAETL